jgi:hypothetical protein
MTKKPEHVEFGMGRVASVAGAVKAPKLDPNSKNLAERLAAKATDGRADNYGIKLTGLSKAERRKILGSFPSFLNRACLTRCGPPGSSMRSAGRRI